MQYLFNGKIGVGTFEKGSAHKNSSGNIFFNTKSLKSGIFDNTYNIKSTLNHEIGYININESNKNLMKILKMHH